MRHNVLFLIVFSLVSESIKAQTWADPKCADVVWDFLPCLNFLKGIQETPSWGCCSQLNDLKEIAKEKKGKQRICQCIQDLVFEEGKLITSRIALLSSKCGVKPEFPISNDMNCKIIS